MIGGALDWKPRQQPKKTNHAGEEVKMSKKQKTGAAVEAARNRAEAGAAGQVDGQEREVAFELEAGREHVLSVSPYTKARVTGPDGEEIVDVTAGDVWGEFSFVSSCAGVYTVVMSTVDAAAEQPAVKVTAPSGDAEQPAAEIPPSDAGSLPGLAEELGGSPEQSADTGTEQPADTAPTEATGVVTVTAGGTSGLDPAPAIDAATGGGEASGNSADAGAGADAGTDAGGAADAGTGAAADTGTANDTAPSGMTSATDDTAGTLNTPSAGGSSEPSGMSSASADTAGSGSNLSE